MHRLLPLIIFVAILLYTAFNFQSISRDLLYSIHLSGDKTSSCCSVAEILKNNGSFDEDASIAMFNNQLVDYPKTSLAYAYNSSEAKISSSEVSDTQVLGTTNTGGEEKWIEVSLHEQRIRAWEGNKVVMEFPISSGRWAPTPEGTFNIWYKTRYQRMTGGSPALGTFYDLPNVPYNMFFYSGFAIHGAYWHNNFGHPMSHGCVNEPLANAAQIFDWAGPVLQPDQNVVRATPENPGTRVWIH